MSPDLLMSAKDAGVAIILIVFGYFILRLLVSSFHYVTSGDREDFKTIKNIWEKQAELQKETNSLQRASNEILLKMSADIVSGQQSIMTKLTTDVSKLMGRADDIQKELSALSVKLDKIGNKTNG